MDKSHALKESDVLGEADGSPWKEVKILFMVHLRQLCFQGLYLAQPGWDIANLSR